MKALITGGALLAAAAIAGTLSPDVATAQIDVDGERPMAGEYRSKISFQSFDVPGAPPQMADMMNRMMSRETTYCLTEEEIEEGYRAILNRTAQDGAECEYERFSYSGGAIDAVMTCDIQGRPMQMVMQGTGNSTASDINMTISGDFGLGEGSMRMRAEQEYLGACS